MLDPSILVGAGTQPPSAVPKHPASAPVGDGLPLVDDGLPLGEPAGDKQWPLQTMAAAVELTMRLDSADELPDAAQRLAVDLQRHLSAQRAFVLWRRHDGQPFTLLFDTAAGDHDHQQQSLHRVVIAAAEEVVVRGGATHWPPVSGTDRHALLAVAQLADRLGCNNIDGIDLHFPAHPSRGVILVVGATAANAGGCLRVLAAPLASRLSWIDQRMPSRPERAMRRLVQLVRQGRRSIVWATLGLAAVVLMMPLRYQVAADLVLQPVQHRYVAAPFDGPLQQAHVRPGDVVRQGDLLASINPREIEYELAGIQAELNRAVQDKKAKMAQHDSAGSQIAELETDRLRLKSELLQHRRTNLQIRSPINGMVVTGDWKQREGIPLSRGDTLFEIAPLGQMVVELSVAEDDFAEVRRGMPVDFQVHALPGRRMTGKIDRIHPRAELRQHDNVFIAEVRITDPENVLRPGMRGHGRIAADRHTLAWKLFHKPYYALRRAVGW